MDRQQRGAGRKPRRIRGAVLVTVALAVPLLTSATYLLMRATAGPTAAIMPQSDVADRPAQTTGCDQAPPVAPGTSTTQTLVSDGLRRTYLLHVPQTYGTNTKLPVVLVFHGGASRPIPAIERDMETWTGFSRLADHDTFIAVYPRSTTAQELTRWNTGARQDPTVDDIRFVSNLLDRLQATLCVDPRRVYATGFSSGGGMTGVLACRMAGRIAAFAAVSGHFVATSSACSPARPVPVLEFHGTNDDKLPYDGDPNGREPLQSIPQWLGDWAGRDRCQGGPTVFLTMADVTAQQWTQCAGSSTVVHYRIQGGTHAWPGTREGTGTVNATAVIWEFFKAHRLPEGSWPGAGSYLRR